jgi:hypothetical protein
MMFWTILAILVGFVHSQTATNVKNVLTELFTTRSYNKLVRPTTNQSDPSGIYIEFVLFGINDVDEIQQKLTTTAYLEVYTCGYITKPGALILKDSQYLCK